MNVMEEQKMICGVPLFICRAESTSPKPLVIISHGFTRSKEDFKANGYLKELAERGYYAVAIDNRLHGDRPGPSFQEIIMNAAGKVDLYLLRKAIKETADDVKRLIDVFSAEEGVQQDRIAMVGVSMGGFVTHRAVVMDNRIKVATPIISSPCWNDIPGDIPVLQDEKMMAEWDSFSGQYQPSEHMDEYYPTALLMQIGENDPHYNVEKIKEFYKNLKTFYSKTPEKLNLMIYPGLKHDFTPEMWENALTWLSSHL